MIHETCLLWLSQPFCRTCNFLYERTFPLHVCNVRASVNIICASFCIPLHVRNMRACKCVRVRASLCTYVYARACIYASAGACIMKPRRGFSTSVLLIILSGSYSVIMSESHFRDLMMSHCRPPPAKVAHTYTMCDMYIASVPGLPRYVRILICGGGNNGVKTWKAWAE